MCDDSDDHGTCRAIATFDSNDFLRSSSGGWQNNPLNTRSFVRSFVRWYQTRQKPNAKKITSINPDTLEYRSFLPCSVGRRLRTTHGWRVCVTRPTKRLQQHPKTRPFCPPPRSSLAPSIPPRRAHLCAPGPPPASAPAPSSPSRNYSRFHGVAAVHGKHQRTREQRASCSAGRKKHPSFGRSPAPRRCMTAAREQLAWPASTRWNTGRRCPSSSGGVPSTTCKKVVFCLWSAGGGGGVQR